MKKIFRQIRYLISILIFTQSILIKAVTEKTFLSTTPAGNTSCYMRDIWLQNIELKGRDDIQGRVVLRSAYWQSYNKQGLGRYFGVNDKPTIVTGERIDDTVSPAAIVNATSIDLDERRLIFGQASPVASATVKFAPQQDFFTMVASYEQSCSCLVHGLLVRLSIPFEHVSRRLNASICSDNQTVYNTIANFFTGNFASELQVPLTHAKLSKKQTSRGLGDIELGIRYDLMNKQTLKFDIGFQGIIPCANKPRGEFLFEPLRGHAGHGGCGFDVHVSRLVYDNFWTTVQFVGVFDARYFFSTNQKRTIGLKERILGQYILLGQAGQTKLLPAANVLTMPLKIDGYTELSASCGINVNHYGWFSSLVYQLKTREEEQIHLKNCWNETTYAVTSFAFDGSPFGLSPNDFDLYANNWITSHDLDLQAAVTPGFLVHEIGFSVGKVFDCDAQTLLVSVGASGEFSGRNFPAQSWGVEMCLGVSF